MLSALPISAWACLLLTIHVSFVPKSFGVKNSADVAALPPSVATLPPSMYSHVPDR